VRVGTKSLIFGVHQFAWHPWTVARAWRHLYGHWPTWREAVCIAVHDWGYWGSPNINGPEGEWHPVAGAAIAGRLFDRHYHQDLCLYHSRHYARAVGVEPSALCWPDKQSLMFDPPWFYLFRARLSGELAEHRQTAATAGVVPLSASDTEWLAVMHQRFHKLVQERRGDAISYDNPPWGAGR
jgi:hypothetical protein